MYMHYICTKWWLMSCVNNFINNVTIDHKKYLVVVMVVYDVNRFLCEQMCRVLSNF